MTYSKDKREYERFSCETPIMIYRKDNPDKYYYGRTYNYSEGGMYLETNAGLEVDKNYMIKMMDYREGTRGPEQYQEYDGTVRWIHSNASYDEYSYSDYNYGYGLEYSKPIRYH